MDIFRGSYIFLTPQGLHPSSGSQYTPRPHTNLHPLKWSIFSFCWRFFLVNAQRYGRTGLAAWIDKRLKKRHNTSTPIWIWIASIWTLLNLTCSPSSESKRYKWNVRKQFFRNSFSLLHVSQKLGLHGEISRNSVTGLVEVQVHVPACRHPSSRDSLFILYYSRLAWRTISLVWMGVGHILSLKGDG